MWVPGLLIPHLLDSGEFFKAGTAFVTYQALGAGAVPKILDYVIQTSNPQGPVALDS